MDVILFPVVLLVYCSLSGNKRLSSTYKEIKTISLLRIFKISESAHTRSSIFLQLTQAYPVKSIKIGLLTFLAYVKPAS